MFIRDQMPEYIHEYQRAWMRAVPTHHLLLADMVLLYMQGA